MKGLKYCAISYIIFSLPLVMQAQQGSNPEDNIPVPPASVTPVSSYPALYNHAFGENKLNYIRTWLPDEPMTEPNDVLKHRQQTRYFDGLGRPLQEVDKQAHADGNDIVTHHFYDAVGRESIQYLPFARQVHNSQGNYDNLPKARIESFYPLSQGEQPYSVTEYDNSPLNRPKKVMAPGKSWVGSGRGVLMDYTPNADPKHIIYGDNPVHYVNKGAYPHYSYNTGYHNVIYEGNYAEGDLFVTKVRDEDNHLKEEIKDKNGRLVMSRVLQKDQSPYQFPAGASPELNLRNYSYTFYIYDELGRLCFVLPPQDLIMGAATYSTEQGMLNLQGNYLTRHIYTHYWNVPNYEQMNELCYQYRYDKRGRLIERKIPGKAIEYFVYDQRDRLVLSQDGNLREQEKWAFGFYDGLNRPTITGLVNLSDSHADLQTQAMESPILLLLGSWSYYVFKYNDPAVNLYPANLNNGEILSYNFYDDYSPGLSFFDASKLPIAPANDASVVASTRSNATYGMLTATKAKVLDPANPNNNLWMTTVFNYDHKGHMIQSVSSNMKGGLDYNSQLYYFRDMPYQTVTNHHNPGAQGLPGATALNHIKLDKTYRRNLGTGGNEQVWQLQQKINDGAAYNLAYYDYDHMGRNVIKQFSMVNVLQEYNIRGWLKLIHARNPMYPDSTYFREQLYYDDGFENKLYSGNIAGITWNNYGVIPANDSKRNAYGYSYDQLGRLIHAEYRNNLDPGIWMKSNKDYTASEITYDERGNILTMTQRGNDLSGPVTMDKLTYEYPSNSNKLIKVKDNGIATTSIPLPDFKDNSDITEEYTYDNNGNLLTDANKAITSITYNHMNKPEVITVEGKGSITYVYDAMGNRLQKRVHDIDAQTTETWDYMGNFVYKDNVLQYILNEEGRSRPEVVSNGPQSGATKFVYDYFIKDHLGNVRTTLAAEPSGHEYYARHEMATANSEQLLFDNIAFVRDDKPGSTNPEDLKAARLNADDKDRRIGTAIMLRVMPGDQFSFAADAYYEADTEPRDYTHTGAEDIVSSLLATLSGGTVGGQPVNETPTNDIINEMFTRPENITAIEDIINNSTSTGTAPRAGLNYLFFDENMNLLSGSGRLAVGPIAPGVFENLSSTTATALEPGFVVVYVDNQTMGKDVWFDNVQVLHFNTQVLEENHYYPFGLTTSVNAMGITAQPLKYQTKELEKSFGIEMYDFSARMYDPQLGRTWQPDPMAFIREWVSPYSWVQNNPVIRIDPSGAIDGLVFGTDGEERGETVEGKNGNVIIYDGNLKFKNMTEQELLDSNDGAMTFDKYQDKMDGPTQAKIMTKITEKAEGMMVNGLKFSMKNLVEKIFFDRLKIEEKTKAKLPIPNFVTSYGGVGTPMISYTGSHTKNYETTFANIILSIVVHEWYTHGMKSQGDLNDKHHLAYENVIKHPLWKNSTNQYKAFNLVGYKAYLCDEKGLDLDEETFKLFVQYLQYYKK